jgi:hypothetical protein
MYAFMTASRINGSPNPHRELRRSNIAGCAREVLRVRDAAGEVSYSLLMYSLFIRYSEALLERFELFGGDTPGLVFVYIVGLDIPQLVLSLSQNGLGSSVVTFHDYNNKI